MRKRSAIAFVMGLLLAATLFAAGCGGDDDNGGGSATADGGSTTAANVDSGGGPDGGGNSEAESGSTEAGANETDISKKEFIRKAEAICYDVGEKSNAEIMARAENTDDPEAAFKELYEKADEIIPEIVVPSYREEIERIRALGYPRGDEAEIEAMLSALEEVLQRAEAEPVPFSELNTVEGEPGNPYQRADDLARKYGLEVCPRV